MGSLEWALVRSPEEGHEVLLYQSESRLYPITKTTKQVKSGTKPSSQADPARCQRCQRPAESTSNDRVSASGPSEPGRWHFKQSKSKVKHRGETLTRYSKSLAVNWGLGQNFAYDFKVKNSRSTFSIHNLPAWDLEISQVHFPPLCMTFMLYSYRLAEVSSSLAVPICGVLPFKVALQREEHSDVGFF